MAIILNIYQDSPETAYASPGIAYTCMRMKQHSGQLSEYQGYRAKRQQLHTLHDYILLPLLAVLPVPHVHYAVVPCCNSLLH